MPGLAHIGHQLIVPEHIFSKVEQPETFSNPNPVGTGPFTEILKFDQQVWDLGRNPFYWQEGKPMVAHGHSAHTKGSMLVALFSL